MRKKGTVGELRRNIQEIVNVEARHGPPDLFFQDKRLQNDSTLEMYRIEDGSNLDLHISYTKVYVEKSYAYHFVA